ARRREQLAGGPGAAGALRHVGRHLLHAARLGLRLTPRGTTLTFNLTVVRISRINRWPPLRERRPREEKGRMEHEMADETRRGDEAFDALLTRRTLLKTM